MTKSVSKQYEETARDAIDQMAQATDLQGTIYSGVRALVFTGLSIRYELSDAKNRITGQISRISEF